jgi:hypothetical protein
MAPSGLADGMPQRASGTAVAEGWPPLVVPRRGLTTPTCLRLASIVIAASVVALGVVAASATLRRHSAAKAVAAQASSVLIDAEDLYVALADADASASTAYLQAGEEPRELRARYRADLQRASERLTALSGQPLPAEARPAIEAIASALPLYAGLVESARTNSRLEHPLGAAYLRRASDLMRNTVLPSATSLYRQAAGQLDRSYRAGSTSSHEVALIVLGAVALSTLIASQVLVSWRTRRVLNLGLLVATIAVALLGVWTLHIFDGHERALGRSQLHGSDPLTVLSTARIQVLRTLRADNLDLIERGTDRAHQQEFTEIANSIRSADGSTGLLVVADQLARQEGAAAGLGIIPSRYDDYLAAHDRVLQLHTAGSYDAAVRTAVTDQASAAAVLDRALAAEIDAARRQLQAHARDAQAGLPALAIAVGLLTVAAVGFAVTGLRPRLREYR